MSEPLPLERFASIQAALEAGCARDAVLAEAGLSGEAWDAARERWLGRLAAEAARGRFRLDRRYFELLAEQRRAAAAEARAERKKIEGPIPVAPTVHLASIAGLAVASVAKVTPPAASPRARLGETSMALGDAIRQALPFKSKTATPAAAGPPASAAPAAELPKVPPRSPLAGTSMALPPLAREAFPFKAGTPAAASAVELPKVPPRSPLAGTSMALPPVAREALPFKTGTPAAEPAVELPKVPPRSPLAGTSMALPPVARAALPFKTGTAAPAASLEPAPPQAPSTPTPEAMARLQSMNLGLYAQICGDVRARPEQVEAVRRHYGLEGPVWAALHALWAQRFAQDPALRERWQALIEQRVARAQG